MRPAAQADIPELVRLKRLTMLSWPIPIDLESDPTWRERAGVEIARQMAGGDFIAYVVDAPAQPDGRLAACIFASIERHIPGPKDNGLRGYVASMCTEPELRGRGLGTELLNVALNWFEQRGVSRARLWATESGAPIYRKIGFVTSQNPFELMDLRLEDRRR